MTTTTGLLLAAGQSRRFGPEDKLLADLGGRPVVCHAAAALAKAGCDHLVAVTSNPAVAQVLTEFEHVAPVAHGAGQSASLRAGVLRAAERGANRVLVVLGDMPLVTPETMRAILVRGLEHGFAATSDGLRRMPPICFENSVFSEVLDLTGDKGARAKLQALPEAACVMVSAHELGDIDTVDDLETMRRNVG
ncbi:MAG: nucleotidyltransferase family protein [Pseudomonadota bacterium]